MTRDSIPQQLKLLSKTTNSSKLGRSLKTKTKQNPRSPMLRGIWIYMDLRTTIHACIYVDVVFCKYEINNQLEVTLLGQSPTAIQDDKTFEVPSDFTNVKATSQKKHPKKPVKQQLWKVICGKNIPPPKGIYWNRITAWTSKKGGVSQAKGYGWRSTYRWIGFNYGVICNICNMYIFQWPYPWHPKEHPLSRCVERLPLPPTRCPWPKKTRTKQGECSTVDERRWIYKGWRLLTTAFLR